MEANRTSSRRYVVGPNSTRHTVSPSQVVTQETGATLADHLRAIAEEDAATRPQVVDAVADYDTHLYGLQPARQDVDLVGDVDELAEEINAAMAEPVLDLTGLDTGSEVGAHLSTHDLAADLGDVDGDEL